MPVIDARPIRSARQSTLIGAACLLLFVSALCAAQPTHAAGVADGPAALHARYAALAAQLEHSPFPQHLYVESFEGERDSSGDVYSVVDYPIATVSAAFANPSHWCDVLILHLNVKYCHPLRSNGSTQLSVAIGRKRDESLASAVRIAFAFRTAAARPDFLDVGLEAPSGPVGTRDYRIRLEAVGVDPKRSFIHLRYAYGYDAAARTAMRLYLATTGSDKVGFTVVGDPRATPPKLIGGARGAIERNTMRYYLAIEAYLGTLSLPAADRVEKSFEWWFDATERYARQLHEIDRDAYLEMKRREYQRQQIVQ